MPWRIPPLQRRRKTRVPTFFCSTFAKLPTFSQYPRLGYVVTLANYPLCGSVASCDSTPPCFAGSFRVEGNRETA